MYIFLNEAPGFIVHDRINSWCKKKKKKKCRLFFLLHIILHFEYGCKIVCEQHFICAWNNWELLMPRFILYSVKMISLWSAQFVWMLYFTSDGNILWLFQAWTLFMSGFWHCSSLSVGCASRAVRLWSVILSKITFFLHLEIVKRKPFVA